MTTKCYKCNSRIKSHLWIVGDNVYCSGTCQRGGKSQFEKLYAALRKL